MSRGGITIRVDNTNQLMKDLRNASVDVRADVQMVLREQARIVRDDAKVRVPVDSGALQASIKASNSRKYLSSTVSAGGKTNLGDAYYAFMVEYGTKKMDAREFFWPAVRAHEEETEILLIHAMTKKLKEAVEG